MVTICIMFFIMFNTTIKKIYNEIHDRFSPHGMLVTYHLLLRTLVRKTALKEAHFTFCVCVCVHRISLKSRGQRKSFAFTCLHLLLPLIKLSKKCPLSHTHAHSFQVNSIWNILYHNNIYRNIIFPFLVLPATT